VALAVGRGFQILGRIPDHTGRIDGHNLGIPALQELKKPLGVFLLILGRFREEG